VDSRATKAALQEGEEVQEAGLKLESSKSHGASMKKLSTGQDSTLGNYLKLTDLFFGKGSAQSEFIQQKIAEATINGANEEVLAPESQMLMLLGSMPMRSLP
jgi:hypothetical protein